MKFRTWILPLAALAAVGLAVINEVAYQRSTEALVQLGQRAEARGQIQLLWRALIDAETAQRGYLHHRQGSDNLTQYQEGAETARQVTELAGPTLSGRCAGRTGAGRPGDPWPGQVIGAGHDAGPACRRPFRGLARPDAHRHRPRKDGRPAPGFAAAAGDRDRARCRRSRRHRPDAATRAPGCEFHGSAEPAGADALPTPDAGLRTHAKRAGANAAGPARPAGGGSLEPHGRPDRAGAASAIGARRRKEPPGARTARRTRRRADSSQTRRRAVEAGYGSDAGWRRRAAAALERIDQHRHRTQAPHHRGVASVVAEQPGAHRRAGHPGARVRLSQRGTGQRPARCRGVERQCPDHRFPPRPGSIDQRQPARGGHADPGYAGSQRSRSGGCGAGQRACASAGRWSRFRHGAAPRHDAWADGVALSH